jgi:hypothetical protein
MKQRGRKSGAALSVIQAEGSELPTPPDTYTDQQAHLWSRIVAEKPAEWWDTASLPMLDELVKVTTEIERISALLSATPLDGPEDLQTYKELNAILDKQSSQRKRLMSSLRLSHQSRYNPKSASTAGNKGGGKRPWSS